MPTKNNQAYLFDIKQAIIKIDRFLVDINSFHDYINDEKTFNAVERQLSILSEAVVQYCKTDQLTNSSKIKGFRNRLIHAYDSIDHEIVWSIVKRYLPQLLIEVDKKLKN